ncbi:MAG: peptide deformylase [Bacteroidales bacterium]|jgi:peptide deformylase|nr:peptide deformylase [Bacteroidales bacterium]
MNSARRTICLTLVLVGLICSCTPKGWSEWEKTVIAQSDSVMYVCVMPQDSAILRATSTNLGPEELKSAELKTLLDKMYRTLTDPSQDGVGIAAPQIGINRRMVLVMRYDKPGQPIEPYLNIQIDSLLGEKEPGPEGCLSVPPYRGIVRRYPRIQISYVKPDGTPVTENVEGYSAVIFQHECDHLDGILYIDRADTVTVNEAWAAEREAFSYERPAWWK